MKINNIKINNINKEPFDSLIKIRGFLSLVILLGIIIGCLYIYKDYINYKEKAQNDVIAIAESAKSFISIDLINALDINADDINKPEYKQLKESMIMFKSHNEGVIFAYLYTYQNGKVYFMVDSESPDSEGYSPPGQEYYEATIDVISPFTNGQTLFAGPTEDRWGSWVNVLAPIQDSITGETIAVFGIDFAAEYWEKLIFNHVMKTIILTSGILLLLFALVKILVNNIKLKELSIKLKESQQLFKTVFEQASVGIAVVNKYKFHTEMNSMFEKILGRSKEELININWIDITHPDDLEKDLELFSKFKEGIIDEYSMEKRYIRPDNSYVWVNMEIRKLHSEKYADNHICIIQDINQRKIAEKSLYESERVKSILLSSIPGMAYCFNNNWEIQYLSEGCYMLTGFNTTHLLKKNLFETIIAPEYWESRKKIITNALEKKSSFRAEYEIITAINTRKWVIELGKGSYDDNDELEVIGGIIIDITESKQQLIQIKYMYDHDILTGLYNRQYFENVKIYFDKEDYMPLTIMIMDINGMKLINNAFGSRIGDKIIRETANIIKKCCNDDYILARTGGDEFSILMPKASSNEAYNVFCKIKEECEAYNKKIHDHSKKINLSIGYGTKNNTEQNFYEIEKEAEDFLMKRKLLERKSHHNAILSSIMVAMGTNSQETEEHAQRISEISKIIGEKLGLSQSDMDNLKLFSMLHDIGKICIDNRILNKTDKLNEEEWSIIKKHPELGYRIAKSSPGLEDIADYILSHHERWDGKGYPKGSKGVEIPLLSRILAVADAYDAMTNDRPYRKALSNEEAIDEIKNNMGTQFDPQIASLFIESFQ